MVEVLEIENEDDTANDTANEIAAATAMVDVERRIRHVVAAAARTDVRILATGFGMDGWSYTQNPAVYEHSSQIENFENFHSLSVTVKIQIFKY